MTGMVGGGGGGGWRKGGPGKRNVDRGGWGWWIDGGVGGRECWRPRAVRVGVDDFIQSSLGIIGRANPKLFNWRPVRGRIATIRENNG